MKAEEEIKNNVTDLMGSSFRNPEGTNDVEIVGTVPEIVEALKHITERPKPPFNVGHCWTHKSMGSIADQLNIHPKGSTKVFYMLTTVGGDLGEHQLIYQSVCVL